ncbi:MAG: hypothetical protein ABSF92_00225 [Candidatus Acidiferrales bacterium]|jgi:site-specific DNA-adenine methylase
MRLPVSVAKCAGTKGWCVPYVLRYLAERPAKTIVEPFAGSAVVGLTLLYEGHGERLVLAEKDEDYLAFWHSALGDSSFSYHVRKWTEQVLALPFKKQKPFVMSTLERLKDDDPGFWILLQSRVAFNGKGKIGGYMTDRHRGGLLARWPRTMPESLDLLYSLRRKVAVLGDAFEALAATDDPNSYAFIDPTYTVTRTCPGHKLYVVAFDDHPRLMSVLASWRGRWQLTYNDCKATPRLVAGLPATIESVPMLSGCGNGGSRRKRELIVSKRET